MIRLQQNEGVEDMTTWFSRLFSKEQTSSPSGDGKAAPQADFNQEMQKGLGLMVAGNHRMALQCFDRATELKANAPDVWNNKGVCHHECNEIAQAISSCYKALEIDPHLGMAWYNLGRSLAKQKDSEKAIEAYGKAADAAGGIDDHYRVAALTNRGEIEIEMRRFDAAIKSARSALNIDPHYSRATLLLVRTLVDMNKMNEAKDVIMATNDSQLQGFWSVEPNGNMNAGFTNKGKVIYGFARIMRK